MRFLLFVWGLSAMGATPPADTFPFAREVKPSAAGGNVLRVDEALVTHAAPGATLRDLRLFDADGHEVPYLLLAPPDVAPRPTTEPSPTHTGKVLPIHPTRDASGFELDLGSVVRNVWSLRLEGLGTRFLKRARVEGSGDRQHWVSLAEEATFFDLPDEQHFVQDAVVFASGDYRYLRVTWDDHSSGRLGLPSRAWVQSSRQPAEPAPPPLLVEVPFDRRPSESGTSRFHLRLPAPKLPLQRLQLAVGGDHLLRNAQVTEPVLGNGEVIPRPLGTATLRRVVEGGIAAESLEIWLARPESVDLDLVVDDGDNPPLQLNGVHADLGPQPTIYFEAKGTRPLSARFGLTTVEAPRYDLGALQGKVDMRHQASAAWGNLQALTNPPPAPEPALDPAALHGAVVDRASFALARPIAAGPSGLNAVLLDARVLSKSHDLADVRIVDGQSRQIPYLVERRGEPLELSLGDVAASAPSIAVAHGITAYAVTLPQPSLPQARLALSTTQRVFDREVSLAVEEPATERAAGSWRTLATARWAHADPQSPAVPLTLSVPELPQTKLWLLIADGDNAPLPLGVVRLQLPTERLRFFRTSGDQLTLLYGARLATPHYDLALLAPRLVGAPATEVSLGEPASENGTGDKTALDVQGRVFWGALSVAVLLLLGLMARLLKKADAA